MSDSSVDLRVAVSRLAAVHGLELDDSSITVNELGLDFRVAIARTVAGRPWVLRIPRRPDVIDRAETEARLLRLVAPHLTAAVPDWRIHTRELIAYPLLPGEPGLDLDAAGEPQWHVDVSSSAFATSLGEFLAQLHGVDVAAARAAGAEIRSPAQVREGWRADLARVTANFDVAPRLQRRWTEWIGDDSYWPSWSVLTHGEIYPGHTLVVDEQVTAVIDWTTAAVGDPAKDFMFHQATASSEAFDETVRRYVDGGGRVWPRFAEHCAEMFSASPVNYGLYALLTGDAQHREAAAAQLDPPDAP